MLFNVVRLAIFLAAAGFAQSATTTHHQAVEVVKREPCGYGGCQEGQGHGFPPGHPHAGGFIQGGPHDGSPARHPGGFIPGRLIDEPGRHPGGFIPGRQSDGFPPDHPHAGGFIPGRQSDGFPPDHPHAGGFIQGGQSDGYTTANPHARSWIQGGAGASAGVGAGLDAMVQGWGQLTPAFNQLQSSFSSGASIHVAIQAALSFRAQIQSVSRHHSSCGCSATAQASAAFQAMAVQFFSSFQLALQTGRAQFGAQWDSQFRPIFEQCSSALTTMHSIAVALRVDLRVVLSRARVNAQIFAGVGLNLSALLGINIGIGGLLQL